MSQPIVPMPPEPSGDFVVTIDGREVKIAPDDRQPGGSDRSNVAFRVVGSVYQAAQEIRRRNADRA